MSVSGVVFSLFCSISDRNRDRRIPLPQGVTTCCNISYSSYGNSSLLDVYYPDGTSAPLPTIVSIHGGGYVYGTKEIYKRYGMSLASRGFAFVNFNYRLAPKWKFPTPLEDTNAVMEWICANSQRYHLDPTRIIIVGDSAGAQLASQYAAIAANPDYAVHFTFKVPEIKIRALGLNCGMYDLRAKAGGTGSMASSLNGMMKDYFGSNPDDSDPRFAVLDAINTAYPPTYLATACHDFLRENAEPMYQFLTARGIPCQWKCYGSEERKEVAHVFHVNIALPEAAECNDDECRFFRNYI